MGSWCCFLPRLGPFGAKEAGEGSLSGFPGAVAAAIADAIGHRVTELPITPDRLMAAIETYEKAQRVGAV